MRKTNLRKSNGITLIALVITIIVLLILAGVAISMLSGENGILKKAAEAKTKTEEGQKQEETALSSMELETHFQTENSKYKCSNGFITGITVETKVSEFQSALPDGYTVKAEDETDNFTATDTGKEDGTPIVATGLAIQKDNKTVARTVIYGDVNCDGTINSTDSAIINSSFSNHQYIYVDYIKEAMDVNHDGYISCSRNDFEIIINGKNQTIASDSKICTDTLTSPYIINQDIYAKNPKDIKIFNDTLIKKEFMDNLTDAFKASAYKFVYNEQTESYSLEGVTETTTAKELIDLLPGITINKRSTEYTGEENFASGTYNIKIQVNKYGFNEVITLATFVVK